jgi:hypothetical protein
MAMLVLPDVFKNTWGIEMQPFWIPTIQEIRAVNPGFKFIAEVYWDLEWSLQEQGFDYTYDKRLYDRLMAQEARPVREHLLADLDFQLKSVRFLENHDERRAAEVFPPQVLQAAAVITYLIPGMRFFHQGQLVGSRTHIPMQLCRTAEEHPDPKIWAFYARLLEIIRSPILRSGNWQLLECQPAWQSNWTWDSFVAFSWMEEGQGRILVVVNYSSHQSQCYVRFPRGGLTGMQIRLEDLLDESYYLHSGDDLDQFGLYLDMPAWSVHVFEITFE